MDKKTLKFFRYSVAGTTVGCVIVFIWLTTFMSIKTEESIKEISNTYMSEMSLQIQQKFQSIIDLCQTQLEGIIDRTPPETVSYGEDMIEELKLSAQIRNFSYLALYAGENDIEVIYGSEDNIFNDTHLMFSLGNGGNIVTSTQTSDGEKLLILGKAAAYPMKDGKTSIALIVGLPMEYLNEALFLSGEDSSVYFHIIEKDGTFVIRNADAYRENYFDRVMETFEEYKGKKPEEYVRELKDAISTDGTYYARFMKDGSERQMYAAPLPENSSWYLISGMDTDFLTKSISELASLRVWVTLGTVLSILLAMTFIFIKYFHMSQKYIADLAKARKEAVRANMAKSDFLSSMSHDIRTPMNAIIGMTGIAQKNIQDTDKVDDCLRKISLSSKHLLGLINDVLDMSKIESGKMVLNIVPTSLREIMDDIVNIVQPQIREKEQFFDIFIQNIISENVYCDSVRLNQVLLNLLSNAVKFTPSGGRIDVHMYQEQMLMGNDFIRTHFLISDTGIGMSPEFQAKIWDTFAREETDQVRHIVGSGLGTSIAKKIVDLMGGTIELESEPGKGSTFHVILDLQRSDVSEEEMKLPEWNILVVDDNEQLCTSAVSSLEELGVHAEWTLDGMEAIKRVEERHKQNDDYQFVLIDWKMPGMNGIETIREIRKRIADIPIFLISSYDWSEMEEHIDASMIEGFISKPLFKSTLYHRLKQYVDGFNKSAEEGNDSEIDFAGKHILLAEDIDLNWEVASEILSVTGVELQRAVNGKECLEIFEKSEIGYYDVILMDIRMPVMDGYDATKAIKALERSDSNLPIIAMTADAFSDDAQRCLACGMAAHIAKPIDVDECMRILQQFLGKQEKSENT